MNKSITFIFVFILALAVVPSFAQNSNTSTPSRPRTTQQEATPTPSPAPRTGGNRAAAGAKDPTSKGVLAAFNSLLDGIRAADVEVVTAAYWNSPQLVLFNNNGTVTKGWEQMRKNRESSYPNLKNVKLDVRDVRVQMVGRDGAVVTCLWTQTQTYRDATETASGRMTLVFRRIAGEWKAIHLHTSPDAPDPSRVLPSEQTTPATATPKPKTTP